MSKPLLSIGFNPCLSCYVCQSICEYKIVKNLVLDLVSAIENGVEDQEIKYAEKVVNDNEELIKEIRK